MFPIPPIVLSCRVVPGGYARQDDALRSRPTSGRHDFPALLILNRDFERLCSLAPPDLPDQRGPGLYGDNLARRSTLFLPGLPVTPRAAESFTSSPRAPFEAARLCLRTLSAQQHVKHPAYMSILTHDCYKNNYNYPAIYRSSRNISRGLITGILCYSNQVDIPYLLYLCRASGQDSSCHGRAGHPYDRADHLW